MVSAETAVALPALVVVLAVLLWGLAVGIMQVRCVAAARGAALAAARGEADGEISAQVRRTLGTGSVVTVRRHGEQIRVEVAGRVAGLRWLPARTVNATAVATAEPGHPP
jgi:hypothetical protein